MHDFPQTVCGDDGVTSLETAVPGAVADAAAAAVAAWDVGPGELGRIDGPVLNVVDGVGHLLMAAAPRDVATRLDAVWPTAG